MTKDELRKLHASFPKPAPLEEHERIAPVAEFSEKHPHGHVHQHDDAPAVLAPPEEEPFEDDVAPELPAPPALARSHMRDDLAYVPEDEPLDEENVEAAPQDVSPELPPDDANNGP